MAFAYGLGGLLLFPLRFGASTVLLQRFTPEAMVESIRENKVTVAFCAPISLRMMLKQFPSLRESVQSLRLVVSAGETLPASVYRAWGDSTGIEVLDGLGSTEMLHIFISSRAGRSRAGATGEVVPGYQAAVIDEKTMQPVPDGEPGLLAVKGPTGCRYLRLTYRQQHYVRQGWNIPVMSTFGTATVSSTINAATTTSSSAAASTSLHLKSRVCCSNILECSKPPSSRPLMSCTAWCPKPSLSFTALTKPPTS